VRLGRDSIAAEAVDGHDTNGRLRLAKPTKKGQIAGQIAASGSSRRTYSITGDEVTSFGEYTMDSAI
jgi:hypothetical protein